MRFKERRKRRREQQEFDRQAREFMNECRADNPDATPEDCAKYAQGEFDKMGVDVDIDTLLDKMKIWFERIQRLLDIVKLFT